MDFDFINAFDNVEMSYVSFLSKGYISRNRNIFHKIKLTDFTRFVLKSYVYGTPIFKFGDGGKRLLILSGVHGNELPSQLASLQLLNEFLEKDLSNTVYIVPLVSPESTMYNERTFNSRDLNRSAHIRNSLSSLIIRSVIDLKIDSVGDFHSTSYNSNPGFEAIFSSKNPSPESYLIASHICHDVGSEIISFDFTGSSYKGAVEDVCNLMGGPAVTAEVLSPFASVGKGSVKRSLLQMKSFLSYFGVE